MKLQLKGLAAAVALAVSPVVAQADELQTLGAMHQTNIAVDWQPIPQTGPKADHIRKNLEKIKLPPSFHIALYAIVPDAHHIAVGPEEFVTIVGTRKAKVWAVTDL